VVVSWVLVELKVAIKAVEQACKLCEKVQHDLRGIHKNCDGKQGKYVLLKSDNSPVTLADYGAQTILSEALSIAFPNDGLMAEESSKELDPAIESSLVELVNEFLQIKREAGQAS
jgi:3'-phosphoadenosine 5'-phosphosulfate (PAPS) 3'-phosphatase